MGFHVIMLHQAINYSSLHIVTIMSQSKEYRRLLFEDDEDFEADEFTYGIPMRKSSTWRRRLQQILYCLSVTTFALIVVRYALFFEALLTLKAS